MTRRPTAVITALATTLVIAFLWLQLTQDPDGALDRGSPATGRDTDRRARRIGATTQVTRPSAPPAAAADRAQIAAPDAVPVDGDLVVQVVDPEGRPIGDAELRFFREQQELGRARTGPDGSCRLAAGAGRADVYVRAPSWPWSRHELDLQAGHRRIELVGDGELVSGQVVAIDGPLPEAVLMRTEGRSSLDEWSGLAETTLATFGDWGERDEATAPVAEGGDFVFRGLAPDWCGRLWVSPTHVIVDETPNGSPNEVVLVRPTRDVVIRVSVLPAAVIGRLEDAATGAGIPGEWVHCRYATGVADEEGASAALTDEAGRFLVPIEAPTFEWIDVRAEWRGAVVRRRIDGGFRGTRDIGTLAIGGLHDVSFVVTDSGGEPIAGAIVVAKDASHAATDARGVAVLERISHDVTIVEVGALGFMPQRVFVPTAPEAPVQVTLERTNHLVVRVVDQDGRGMTDVVVSVRSSEPLFPWGDSFVPPSLALAIPLDVSGESGAVRCPVDGQGEVHVYAITPGRDFRLACVSAMGRAYAPEVGPFRLGATEERVIEIKVSRRPVLPIRGFVHDRSGRPIAQAIVNVKSRDGRGSGVESAPDGSFATPPEILDDVILVVEHDDYRTTILVDPLIEPDEPLDIILDVGLEAVVQVVDPARRPLEAQVAIARIEPIPHPHTQGSCAFCRALHAVWYPDDGPDGTHVFSHLPDEPVRLTVATRGYAVERVFDPRQGRVVVELPAHGRLDVHWSEEDAVREWDGVRLTPSGRDAPPAVAWVRPAAAAARSITIESIYPGDYELTIERKGEPLTSPARISIAADATTTLRF